MSISALADMVARPLVLLPWTDKRCAPGTTEMLSPARRSDYGRRFRQARFDRCLAPILELEVHASPVCSASARSARPDVVVTRYWNVTVAMARLTLSGGQKVTGPGKAPGVAILVPWPGWLRICSAAAFDTLTAPSIRNTPSA
jgi:hypothetical protein